MFHHIELGNAGQRDMLVKTECFACSDPKFCEVSTLVVITAARTRLSLLPLWEKVAERSEVG